VTDYKSVVVLQTPYLVFLYKNVVSCINNSKWFSLSFLPEVYWWYLNF